MDNNSRMFHEQEFIALRAQILHTSDRRDRAIWNAFLSAAVLVSWRISQLGASETELAAIGSWLPHLSVWFFYLQFRSLADLMRCTSQYLVKLENEFRDERFGWQQHFLDYRKKANPKNPYWRARNEAYTLYLLLIATGAFGLYMNNIFAFVYA